MEAVVATRTGVFSWPPAWTRALIVEGPVFDWSETPRAPPAVTLLPRVSVGEPSRTLPLLDDTDPSNDRDVAAMTVRSPAVRTADPLIDSLPVAEASVIGPLLAATESTVRSFVSSMATV